VILESHYGELLTAVSLCAQLTHDLLATAKFLVTNSNSNRAESRGL